MSEVISHTQNESENFLRFLSEEKKLAERSIQIYWSYYNRLPAVINQDTVKAFVIQCGNIDAVRGFMKAYLDFNKLSKTIDLPTRPAGRVRKRIVRGISKEDIQTIREYMYKTKFRNGLLWDVIYEGALRRSELSKITLNSFEVSEWVKNPESHCRLRVIGKGDKERKVLISAETMVRLIEHLESKYPNLTVHELFNSTARVFKLAERSVYEIITETAKKVIGRDIRPHELRHQRATELLERGVPIEDIKEYLGHSNLATTQIYLHVNPVKALKNIDDKLSA